MQLLKTISERHSLVHGGRNILLLQLIAIEKGSCKSSLNVSHSFVLHQRQYVSHRLPFQGHLAHLELLLRCEALNGLGGILSKSLGAFNLYSIHVSSTCTELKSTLIVCRRVRKLTLPVVPQVHWPRNS